MKIWKLMIWSCGISRDIWLDQTKSEETGGIDIRDKVRVRKQKETTH